MKLLEYEAKKIFSKYEIPTPKGDLVTEVSQIRDKIKNLKPPFVVKAQVPVAGRGKAGGILFADSVTDVEEAAGKLFNMQIKGFTVRSILVEERVQAESELYLGLTIDRFNKSYVVIGSTEGGIEIEEVAARSPEKIFRFPVDPIHGFQLHNARQLAKHMGYCGNKLLTLASIFHNLYKAGMDYDAELIEMNPLAETRGGEFIAMDARIIIDDNALFRHPEYKEKIVEDELSPQEVEAAKTGLAYVKLDGNIGVIGNGAGLVMATLDVIKLYGGKPANFLDVGGGAPSEKIAAALKIVLQDPDVDTIFINILGGITRCDEVAEGIIQAGEKLGVKKPTVIRLVGTNEEEGKQMLTQAGLHVLDSMEEAAFHVVEIAKRYTKNGDNNS